VVFCNIEKKRGKNSSMDTLMMTAANIYSATTMEQPDIKDPEDPDTDKEKADSEGTLFLKLLVEVIKESLDSMEPEMRQAIQSKDAMRAFLTDQRNKMMDALAERGASATVSKIDGVFASTTTKLDRILEASTSVVNCANGFPNNVWFDKILFMFLGLAILLIIVIILLLRHNR
jgi:hypothetical protein